MSINVKGQVQKFLWKFGYDVVKDEWTFHEIHTFMNEKSYSLVAIVNVFDDEETGQILQVDGIFHRFHA